MYIQLLHTCSNWVYWNNIYVAAATLITGISMQSFAFRIITGNFDYIYIYSKGVNIWRSLNLQTVQERCDYFFGILMFECIHGLATNYLCNDVTMDLDIHGYDTRSGESMDVYTSPVFSRTYIRSFSYMATNLWNQLPTDIKESTTLDSFKQNHKYSKGWIKSCVLHLKAQIIDVLCARI